jgi:hypothetical protein
VVIFRTFICWFLCDEDRGVALRHVAFWSAAMPRLSPMGGKLSQVAPGR